LPRRQVGREAAELLERCRQGLRDLAEPGTIIAAGRTMPDTVSCRRGEESIAGWVGSDPSAAVLIAAGGVWLGKGGQA